MSDYFNRNPFAAKPETPAPSTPQTPKPTYTDYTQEAMKPLPQGGTDYSALAKEFGDQMGDQRRANLEAFDYMTPVTDTEYGIIRNRLLQVKDQGGDFQGEAYKLATAVEMSRYFGRSMLDTIDSFDATYSAWTGREFRPDTTHFRAIADSFKLGSLNIDMGKVARAWMDGGGRDAELEKQLDSLSQQIEKYKDFAPRPWIVEALKAGAESAPFTLRAMGAGALAAGGVALALGTTGLAAPATLGLLKAGASMLGSFSESADTMRGLEYYEMRKAGIDHETAQASANLSGSLQGAVESLLGNIPGIAGAGIAAKVSSRLAIKGGFSAIAKAAAGYLGEAVEEGLEEGIQQIISDTIQNEAKEQFGVDIKDADQIAKDAWESAKGGFTASLVMGLPSSVVGGIKTAKTATALKEYAKTTDRETFIENAGKWEDLAPLSDEEKKATLSKVWEQAQKKAKEQREKAGATDRKPFARTEAGTLYTEETTVGSAEEGKVEAILKVGDAESKERLGYLKYEVTDDSIVITNAPFKKGYEHLREEAVLELAAKYPDLDIKLAEGAPESIRGAVESLEGANPKGTGANWYKDQDPDTARARAKLRLAIADKMPNVSPVQREAAILLHEFRANAQGVGFADYLNNEFSPEIIGTDTSKVSAAQGQRAGILFTKDGQELRIGEFVRDAQALVMVTEKSDFVSFVHESGHLFRKQLIDTDLGKKLDDAYGIQAGQWTRDHEERFVDDLVKYLSYGEAKDERLKSVFQKIAEWITRLWQKVLGQADVDPRVRAVMDELFKSEKSPLSEAARTVAIAEEGEAIEGAKALQLEVKDEVLFQDVKPNSTLFTSSSIDKALSSIEKYFYDKPGDIELVPIASNIWAVKKVKSGKVLENFRVRLDKGRYRFEDGSFGMKPPEAESVKYEGKQAVLFQVEPREYSIYPNKADTQDFISEGAFDKKVNGHYYENRDLSSRTTPAAEYNLKEGTWIVADYKLMDGHPMGQLRLMDVNDIIPTEDLVPTNTQGRGWDSERYADWMREGKTPPPITVLEMENGEYTVSDGHRRYFAAKATTGRVWAWVWPMMDNPRHPDMKTAMTYEAMTGKEWEKPETILFQPAPPEDSEAFRKWFGDSKVVDAEGKPLVVYHGSPDLRWLKEDGAFKSEKERYGMGRDTHAHWFTPSLSTAKTYANPKRAFDYQNAEEGVVACYIKLEKPLVINANGKEWRDAQKVGKTSDVIEQARNGGHDGVIIHNVKDDYNNGSRTRPTDTYVVFSPTQVKSVNNRGTWNADDPRILFQTSAPTDKAKKIFDAVIDYQGVTDDINEAGFVLPDGRMVDLSGRIEDPDYKKSGDRLKIDGVDYLKGKRLQAHSDVRWEGSPQGSRGYLVRQGAVRIDAKFGIIELDNAPTYEQATILRRLYDGREIAIEAHDKGREADIRTDDPKRAMGLLRRFYDGEDVGSVLFQYVGEKAELDETERQNLSIAKEMAQSEKDAETVRLATGWFKGKYDGKWRLETPDIKWKKAGEQQEASSLGDAISAPSLFRKYPELKTAIFSYGPSSEGMIKNEHARGRYKKTGWGPSIHIDASLHGQDALQTITHEIQHAIQDIEGFAQGSSPEQFEQNLVDKHKYNLYSDANVLSVMLRNSSVDGDIDRALALFEKRMNREPELGAKEAAMNLSTEQIREFRDQYAWRDPLTQYTRTAGEIEARDVASRMGLSPEQRRAIPPYSSENIDANDAVVLFQTEPTEEERKAFDSALDTMGQTYDLAEAGYVLPGGELLDMSGRFEADYTKSGRKWKPNRGKDFLKGQRSVDHRDIVYEGQPGDRYETMEQFIGYGAIRIDSNAGLADMARPPTPKQWEIIKEIIESSGTAWLEMRDGKRTATITIEGKPSKALGIIRRFYAGEDVSDSSVLFQAEDYDYRRGLTKVRGGWTKAKIIKEVKVHHAKLLSTYGISREIAKFDSPEELEANIYYHGTPGYISGALKPSITMSDRFIEANGGGGYGQKYWGVSLTKNKKVAESFSGTKSSVNIYPVILKKNAIVKEMPDIKDSADLDDHIEQLWNEGIDAVWIGGGEEELVVLNPVAMAPYREHDSYAVFGGFKSKPLTKKQIVDIYKTGVETYKSITAEMQGKTSAERNAIGSGIPRILFQLDEDAIDAEAATFDSWQAWKEYVEGYAIPAFGEDTRAPEGIQGEIADGWYSSRWEAAHYKADIQKAKAREKERKEARRGEFAEQMAKPGAVEKLLSAIWDAQVQAYDTAQATDEQEQQEIEQAYEWKKDLEQRLGDHPLVLLAAQSIANGKSLKPSTRKAILTYIRHNEIEFAALYAELTGDLDLAQYAEAGRKRLHEIPDPKLEKYADMSIAERTALLNRITDQDVKAKLKDGSIDDPDLLDYIRRLEESKKSLEKEAKENAEEIKKLGVRVDDESYFARRMHEKATGLKKEIESRDKELSKLKKQKARIETAKQAYTDALKSAKEESALSVKIAKKTYIDALQSAQKEARLQTRLVAAEIRATEKLRQQRDSLRRAILKRPSKNIIWEKRQGILTIQEYLRSKKWEYIEEIEEDGKKRRKRAYDTVLGPDGKTHKVPRYTSVQAENLGAALSLLLRESPHLGKLLTNDIVDRINDKPVSAWTVAELAELKKILDTMAKEGRMAYSAKIAQEEYERTEGRNEINSTVRKSKFYKAPFGHGSVEQKELLKNMQKRAVLDLPFLNMRRFASVYMDGGSDGANAKLLVDEERDHYGAKVYQIDRRLGKVFSRMQELELGEKDFQEKVTIEGVGPGQTDYTVSIGDLMAIRLALKDSDAKVAFVYGNLFSEEERRTWNAETLHAHGNAKLQKISKTIDELSPAMKEIADLIGEDFDKEFDRLNKAVIELTNQEMKKVAHYFPIHREGAYFDKFGDSILEELKSKYGMINLPDSGFTLERIKIGASHQTPIKLDLFGTWQKAVERQEHLVSYGSYLKKLNAVYKSRKAGSVREAIIQSFGKAGMDYVDQYISEIANPHEFKGPEEGDRAVRFLRGNMAVGFLAYRWTSVVKQIITSPLPYMAYAPKGMSAAAFQCLKSGNPMQWLIEIESMSQMLKHRTADQIFETIRNMDREGFEGVVKKIGSVGMKGLEMADRFSVAIGWKGVYDEALAKGMTEEEAVKKADDITAKTQPSARGVDLAPVFRGNNEWKRLLLQFGSALNVIYQNIRYDMPQAWREKEFGRAIAIGVSYSIAGVLLGAFTKAIGRDKPEDDEAWYRDWIYYSMTQFTDSVPLIGNELTGFMKRWIAGDKRRFGDSELLPAVEALLSGADNLLEGDILKALEEIGTGLGLGIGLPTLALKEYIEFLINLLGGEGE